MLKPAKLLKKQIKSKFSMFVLVILVPELFRKVRETHTKHSHQFRSKSDGFRMSYEEKTDFKMTQNAI